jgi:hypothetical protein
MCVNLLFKKSMTKFFKKSKRFCKKYGIFKYVPFIVATDMPLYRGKYILQTKQKICNNIAFWGRFLGGGIYEHRLYFQFCNYKTPFRALFIKGLRPYRVKSMCSNTLRVYLDKRNKACTRKHR